MKKNGMTFCRIFILSLCLLANNVFALDYKASIFKSMENFAKDHKIQALYSVSQNGNKLISGAQGFADFEQYKRLEKSQIMPIISITKQITAAAILRLQDNGKLSVQDNLAKHLPSSSGLWSNNKIPNWAHNITIHQLLSHSSGLPEYLFAIDVTETQTKKK
jgi:CubicO group peptidase (beta-lactamase class C family)